MSNTNTYTSSVFTESDIASLLSGDIDMAYAQFNHYSYSIYAPANNNEWSVGIGYRGNINVKAYSNISTALEQVELAYNSRSKTKTMWNKNP